jgi:hypothetical protein
MSHFPDNFWGGVAVTFAVHLLAMWLYHRGPGLVLSPIFAAWRSSSQRAQMKFNREVASLRENKDAFAMATLKALLCTVSFFGLAGLGTALLLVGAFIEFLERCFPSAIVGMRSPGGYRIAAVICGLFLWFLGYFEIIRASNTRSLLRAAARPPVNPSSAV